jgi:excisionase family DNA binding protein
MRKSKSKKSPRLEREVWDRNDVADHFGCSLPHVLKLVRDQSLPCLHLGKLIRFRREDVFTWQTAQVKTQRKGAA